MISVSYGVLWKLTSWTGRYQPAAAHDLDYLVNIPVFCASARYLYLRLLISDSLYGIMFLVLPRGRIIPEDHS